MPTHSFTCKQAIPAFTAQPQSITALWLVYSLYRPTEGRRLSRPGWLVTCRKYKSDAPGSNLDTVTHPNTNGARRSLTSLIETNALPLRQTDGRGLTVAMKLVRGRSEVIKFNLRP